MSEDVSSQRGLTQTQRIRCLRGASVLANVLMTLHLAHDALHTRQGVSLPLTVAILTVWLYGALMLAERRSGQVMMLAGALVGSAATCVHVLATGGIISSRTTAGGDVFFVWSLLASGVACALVAVLAAGGLLQGAKAMLREGRKAS